MAASVPRMTEWNADDDGWERDMPGKGKKKGPAGPSEEMKAKFREALDRKKEKAAGGSDHKDAGVKQPRSHGPLESRREFRRKSG